MPDIIAHKLAAARATAILVGKMAEYYETPEEVAAWLQAKQPLLNDNAPIELIAAGRGDEIYAMLERMDAGVFL